MLFSNAGFEVCPAFLPEAENWITPTALREITHRSTLKSDYKPGWTKRKKHFNATIIVSPTGDQRRQCFSPNASDETIQFALDNSNRIFIINENKPENDSLYSNDKLIQDFYIREPQHLSEDFQKIFAQIVKYLLSVKKLKNISFSISEESRTHLESFNFGKENWLNFFEQQLILNGISHNNSNDEPNSISLIGFKPDAKIINNTSNLKVVFLSDQTTNSEDIADLLKANSIVIAPQTGGHLKIYTKSSARIFPNLTEKPALTRLADFIADKVQNPESEISE
jgi:hypothetical protein